MQPAAMYVTPPVDGPDEQAVVSLFSSTGEVRLLPNEDGLGYRLLADVQGIGPAEAEHSTVQVLTGHGSKWRGSHMIEGRMLLPIMLWANSKRALHDQFRNLVKIMQPEGGDVTVSVWNPDTEESRSRVVRYRSGLDTPSQIVSEHIQIYTLDVTYVDPWWLGPERLISMAMDPGGKAFVSDDPADEFFPVVLTDSTVEGRFSVTIRGAGDVWPSWRVVPPGKDLRITNGSQRIEILGDIDSEILITTNPRRLTPDVWEQTSQRTRFFPLRPGKQTLTVTMVNATQESSVDLVYQERHRGPL